MDLPFGQVSRSIQKLPRSNGTLNPIFIARITIAFLLLLGGCFLSLPAAVKTILLILSVLIGGYDILLDLVDSVFQSDFFSEPVVLTLVALLSFLVGHGWEAALCVIFYQLGLVLINYTGRRMKQSAQELAEADDQDLRDRISVVIHDKAAGDTTLGKDLQKAAEPFLKGLMIAAVLFAVIMPIATELSVKEALYRAMILLMLSLPTSLAAALPLPGIVGLSFAARFGTMFSNARVLEKLRDIKTAVIDKNGVFADNQPQLIGVKSDLLDEETFMEFVCHAVYYSDQSFAKAILAAQDREYRLDLLSDFKDIPGFGVDLKIGGNNVTLAKRELLTERGEAIPYEGRQENSVYYLMVAGKYIGKVLLAENLKQQNADLISDLKAAGVQRCILLTEDSRDESERLGTSLNADEVYAEFTDETKLQYLETLDSSETLYLYANSLQKHSNAAVDVRVSKKGKYADALVSQNDLDGFSAVFSISRRMKDIAVENAVGAFIVKALVLFLGLTGHCTVWFALFLEIVAALAAMLNAIRVTKKPLVSK